MDRLTRHELKQDKFVAEVAQTVEYLGEHRSQLVRYGGIVLAVAVVAAGVFYFMKSRRETRRAELSEAIKIYNTIVGSAPSPQMKAFATEEERQKAISKSLGDIVSKYSGTEEAGIASYLLGVNAADQGRVAEARRYLQSSIQSGGKEYGSLAKLALAELANSEGKAQESEKLLRELIASPTMLVSKHQATLSLARILARSKPEEARKLLEPLRADTGAASRAAITMLAELMQPK